MAFSFDCVETSGQSFSLPDAYIVTRRYFVVCADGLSIVLLACGILILLGNRYWEKLGCWDDCTWMNFSRLRQCSRNILHVNVFLVFLIRSAIQLFTELYMTRGYFARNVFERVDACNRTSTYFKENQVQYRLNVLGWGSIGSLCLFSFSIVNCSPCLWIISTVVFRIGSSFVKLCISFDFYVPKDTKIVCDGTF